MVKRLNDLSSGKILSKLKLKCLKALDKENLNIFLVRQIRKLILQILDNTFPNTHIFKVERNRIDLIFLYMLMLKDIGSSENQLKNFGKMSKPACDLPKAKSDANPVYKSYSNHFLTAFFSIKPVQDVFYILINSIQGDDCDTLNEKFNIFCCDSADHSAQCEINWKEFKEYIKSFYLQSFDIEISSEYFKNPDRLNTNSLTLENLADSFIAK